MKRLKETYGYYNLISYLALILILVAAFGFYLYFKSNPLYQFYSILAASLSYVSWGIVHHFFEKQTSWRIVLEYLLLGILALLLFSWTLFA